MTNYRGCCVIKISLPLSVTGYLDAARLIMQDAEEQTAHFTKMSLVIAISYGGQWDIVNACRQVAKQVEEGALTADAITQDDFARHLSLSVYPPLILVIRTGAITVFLIFCGNVRMLGYFYRNALARFPRRLN